MKRILLALAASLALALGAVGSSAPAEARSGFTVSVAYGHPMYGYHPRPVYRAYYPRYSYYHPARHFACYTLVKTKAYWRYHRLTYVSYPVRSCSWR